MLDDLKDLSGFHSAQSLYQTQYDGLAQSGARSGHGEGRQTSQELPGLPDASDGDACEPDDPKASKAGQARQAADGGGGRASDVLRGPAAEKTGAWVAATKAVITLVSASSRHSSALLGDFEQGNGYALVTHLLCGSHASRVATLLAEVLKLLTVGSSSNRDSYVIRRMQSEQAQLVQVGAHPRP